MTIHQLTERFLTAQAAINNINCGLLAGLQKVRIERINNELADIWAEIERMTAEQKNLTIVNYTAVNYKQPE